MMHLYGNMLKSRENLGKDFKAQINVTQDISFICVYEGHFHCNYGRHKQMTTQIKVPWINDLC